MAVMMFDKFVSLKILEIWWVMLLLYLIPYAVIGWDLVYKAVRNIFRGRVFDENYF